MAAGQEGSRAEIVKNRGRGTPPQASDLVDVCNNDCFPQSGLKRMFQNPSDGRALETATPHWQRNFAQTLTVWGGMVTMDTFNVKSDYLVLSATCEASHLSQFRLA